MRHTKDWPWYRIKAAVEAEGQTLADVAFDAGVEPSSIYHVKRWPNPRLQTVIAKIIGVSALEIWPSRYDRQGQPVSRHNWIKLNTMPPRRRVQKRKVA
jgi:Ner family transcriptional regulator